MGLGWGSRVNKVIGGAIWGFWGLEWSCGARVGF